MSDEQPVTQWIGAVKEGVAPDAEQGLWEEYFQRIVALARVKIGSTPKACEDEEDVAISALKSFFRRVRVGKFPDLNDRTGLWPLLVQTTIWKVNNLKRRHFAQRRDVRRAVSLEWLTENKPTVELADKVIEAGNALLESLSDEKLRSIAGWKLEGHTNAEIAGKIGRSIKTVEWRLKQIRKHLLALMEGDDEQLQQGDLH